MNQHLPIGELRVLAGLLRNPKPGASYAVQTEPVLPAGEVVDLAAFGHTFVRRAGAGAPGLPVVLLHGWTWNADLNFAGVYGPLAEHHPVIAPDVLGHGRSVRPDGKWKLETAGDAVIALLDHLGIDRAIVAGFSLGGVMAADLAHRHPDRVAGIVMQSSAACYTTTARNRILWQVLGGFRPLAHQWPLQTASARGYADSLHRSTSLRERWDWAQGELSRMTLAEILTVADAVRTFDLRPALADPTPCPAEYCVLIHDRLCLPPLQRDLARRVGAVETEVRGDHDMPMVDPEAYGAATVAAVRRVSARVELMI